MDVFTLLWLFLKASLFSSGGTGNLPILYADLIPQGWADERMFAEALAIGQVTPGPTGLWVISLAYLVDGVRGSLLSTIGISVPPFVVLGILWLYTRFGNHPAMKGFVRGLSLAVVGIFLVTLNDILRGEGFDVRTILIVVAAIFIAWTDRIPVIWLMAGAAIVGILIF